VHKLSAALVAAACAALVACGGGGGGGGSGTSISINLSSAAFTASSAGAPPTQQVVTVKFVGDGYLVGYPPELPQPAWLGIQALSQSNGEGGVGLFITNTDLAPQTYSTVVRFVTGRVDGSGIKYKDLPVSFTVTGTALQLSTSSPSNSGLAAQNGALPEPLTITVEYNGDSLQTTLPQQVSNPPSWLQLTETASRPGAKDYRVDFVTSALAPAEYHTSLPFYTQRPGGHRLVLYDLVYTVVAPLAVTPTASSFTHIKGAATEPVPAASRSLVIASGARNWQAASDKTWLSLAAASGTASSVDFSIDRTQLALGTNTAQVTVQNLPTQETKTVSVSVDVRAPRLVVSPTQTGGEVDGLTATDAFGQLELTDEVGGSSEPVSWSVASISAPWLSATPATGTTSPTATVALKVVPAQLAALANGPHSATVKLNYTNADSSGAIDVPVSLVLAMPKVHYVAPYTAAADVPGTVIVRGENFDTVPADLVTIDGESVPVTYVSPTELRITHEGLAAGSHPVTAGNTLGVQPSTTALVGMADPAYAYSAIDSPHQKRRVLGDFERGYIYAVDGQDRDLERYRQVAGAWVGEPVSTPAGVNDIVLTPDGKKLLLLTDTQLLEADAGEEPLTWVQKVVKGPADASADTDFQYGTMAMLNDGRAAIAASEQWSWLQLYDSRTGQMLAKTQGYGYGPTVYGNRGGTQALMNDPVTTVYRYDASTSAYAQASSFGGAFLAIAPFGEKFVVNSHSVFGSGSTSIVGKMDGRASAASVNAAANRAFTFWKDPNVAGNGELRAYELDATTDVDNFFPVVETVPMPDDVGAVFANDVVTLLNPHENTLFVFGNSKFVVVPLP
jgi:hypothetical protein